MTLNDLKRSMIAHRTDSLNAKKARRAVSTMLAIADDDTSPESVIADARAMLDGNKIAWAHVDEIEHLARRGEPALTARENAAREADRARELVYPRRGR